MVLVAINLRKCGKLNKNNAKKRVSLIYNNADINHVLRDKELYLINWEKAKIDIPIYDLYKFYKKYALYFNFKELLQEYTLGCPPPDTHPPSQAITSIKS